MLVTDNDYPRFYGSYDTLMYVVPAPGAQPVHLTQHANGMTSAWRSLWHDYENEVAAKYALLQPTPAHRALYARYLAKGETRV
jgi:hypothetical protein